MLHYWSLTLVQMRRSNAPLSEHIAGETNMKRHEMLAGALMGLLMILPGIVRESSADLIQAANLPGDSGVGYSVMDLANQEGGILGEDMGDGYWFLEGGYPGRPENWLRIYSDQNNQYYGVTGYEQDIDNRPFSGEDANHPFPLVLDTQGPDPITSSNNHVGFVLNSGIDEGREFYQWNMTLFNGATFADGSTNRSGLWDLAQDSTFNLPYYNMSNVQGSYGTLTVTPIPEPFTLSLLAVGAGLAALGSRRRRNNSN